MALLFELPTSRTNKKADTNVVKKVNNKRSASVVVKGGGLLEQISTIKSLVESRLGKYRDEYIYFMADDENAFKEYIYNIKHTGRCGYDTETTGLNCNTDKMVGLSLYSKGQKGLYLPLHHKSYITMEEVEGQLSPKLVAEQLQVLVDAGVKFDMYNAKFDKRMTHKDLRVNIPCWFDAHLAAMCLNENEKHGLKTLHSKYVLQGKEDEWSFGDLFDKISFDLIPIKTAYLYAARDGVDTVELVDFQLPYLTKDNSLCIENDLQNVANVFWNIEMPFLEVCQNMEENGISLDVDYANELSEKYHAILDNNLTDFYKLLDNYTDEINKYKSSHPNHKLSDPISVSSPTQLAILFYDILGIESVDDAKPRGTGEEILEKINHPLCKAILDYRKTEKLLSTYIDKLPNEITEDGKIHYVLNQYGAKTGRLSSDSPNIQNIPSHNKDIRKMFRAGEGNVLISCDYSQQEPRAMTAMCGDPQMIQSYKDNKDLYAQIASIAFNKSYEDCLEFYLDENGNKTDKVNKEGKERRQSSKSILLGILYGRGINSVAEQLNTTKQKAQEIQDKVFKGFPAIKKFEQDTINMAIENGFVTTFWGRKRRLPEMQLPEFEFKWKDGYGDEDPLSFDTDIVEMEVPDSLKRKYTQKLKKVWGKEKRKVYDEAEKEGIIVVDNGGKIADATRQCVNSRIQGSAADLSKMAGIEIYKNERLRELGFKLLIPVHDEYIAECPIEHAKECAEIFSQCMCDVAVDLGIPIKCDAEISERWYGETIELH